MGVLQFLLKALKLTKSNTCDTKHPHLKKQSGKRGQGFIKTLPLKEPALLNAEFSPFIAIKIVYLYPKSVAQQRERDLKR